MEKIYDVDISGCEFIGNCHFINCEGDCYYKQLMRTKQQLQDMENKDGFLAFIRKINTDELIDCFSDIIDEINFRKSQKVEATIKVDLGFWDKNRNYKEDFKKVDISEIKTRKEEGE